MALISNVVTGGTIAATWGNAVRDATVQVTTSAARPGSPAEGMVIYETDTDLLYTYNGSTWIQIGSAVAANTFGTWTTFTPTLVQSNTPTQTATYAKFSRIGKTVWGSVHITLSGTGTAATAITVTTSGLPAISAQRAVGAFVYSRIGTGLYTGTVELSATPTFIFYGGNGAVPTTQFGATPNFQAGAGGADTMKFTFCYETT